MIFYDCATAPSPRRVRIFLAEKGLEIKTVQVDLRHGEHLDEHFRTINPHCTVPVLELDDGTRLLDSNSICLYLDETYWEMNLLGRDAREKAVIAGWNRDMEWNGFMALAEVFRNSSRGLVGRALTGPVNYEQIPALAERGRRRVKHFFAMLDARLGKSAYVAGDRFTVADITAFVCVDFAAWIKFDIPPKAKNLHRWHEEIAARPGSVK